MSVKKFGNYGYKFIATVK